MNFSSLRCVHPSGEGFVLSNIAVFLRSRLGKVVDHKTHRKCLLKTFKFLKHIHALLCLHEVSFFADSFPEFLFYKNPPSIAAQYACAVFKFKSWLDLNLMLRICRWDLSAWADVWVHDTDILTSSNPNKDAGHDSSNCEESRSQDGEKVGARLVSLCCGL